MPKINDERIKTDGTGEIYFITDGTDPTNLKTTRQKPGTATDQQLVGSQVDASGFGGFPVFENILLPVDGNFIMLSPGDKYTRARNLVGSASINLDDNGPRQDLELSVIPNSTVQKLEFAIDGSYESTRKRLNFVSSDNVTLSGFDDTVRDRFDIIIEADGGPLASRTLIPGTGITITNGDGVAGNPIIAVDPTTLPRTGITLQRNSALVLTKTTTLNLIAGDFISLSASTSGETANITVNAAIPGFNANLEDLSDVNIVDPIDNDILAYQSGFWVNLQLADAYLNVTEGGTVIGPTIFEDFTALSTAEFDSIEMSGRLFLSPGSSGSPSYTFISNPSCGIALIDNNISLVEDGKQVLHIDPINGGVKQSWINFSTAGDAISAEYLLKTVTTNDTPTIMLNNSNYLTLDDNSTWMFQIMLTARAANGDSAAYLYNGCIVRNADETETELIGSISENIVAESQSNWSAIVSADDVNGSLNITVTGTNATTIYWLASVKTVEIRT